MPLQWTTFRTEEKEFHRLPTLLTGETDAVLVDASFFLSTGVRIAREIKASGKRLTTVIVTCFDPDFYFGLTAIRAAFPQVAIVAPPVIAAGIAATYAQKVDFWSAQHGAEIPALGDVVIPTTFDGDALTLEGERIEIVRTKQDGYVHLWLPDQKLIVGGVQVSSGNHVWMADQPLPAQRAAWLASLDDMRALAPAEVLPGHLPPGAATGAPAITFTRAYIEDFEIELAKAPNSKSLIAAMKSRYPNLAMDFILDLGARVCTGEQQWP